DSVYQAGLACLHLSGQKDGDLRGRLDFRAFLLGKRQGIASVKVSKLPVANGTDAEAAAFQVDQVSAHPMDEGNVKPGEKIALDHIEGLRHAKMACHVAQPRVDR